ncbi:MAG: glycosyltransferase [Paenibacillaceae bacterium]
MKASVAVLTYNQKETLEACLLSLTHQLLEEGDCFEVIIVDNGSTDGTKEMIANFLAGFPIIYRFIPKSEHSSRAAARNQGIASATGDIIIFLDGDQIAGAHFIYEHLRAHKFSSNKLVIGLRRYIDQGTINLESLGTEFDVAKLPPSDVDERYWLMERFSENANVFRTAWHLFFTCNVSVGREQLIRVGMFNEEFKGWGLEDSELGYRLQLDGGLFVFNKNALVYHVYHSSDFNENRYVGWKTNLDHFISIHPHFEVKAQTILAEFFNPDIRNSWWDCYVRFENVVRAYRGYDGNTPVSIHVVYQNSPEVTKAIVLEAASREIVVIDKTTQSDLDLIAQSICEAYNVLYYKQPTEDKLIELYRMLSARGIWKQHIYN